MDTPPTHEPDKPFHQRARIEFVLHQELAAWVDRETARITGLVEDLTDKISAIRVTLPHPDLPIEKFATKDVLGEPIVSFTDLSGKLVTRLYSHQGRFLGLTDGAMAEAQKVAEQLSSRRELCDLVSRSTILELLLGYVGAVARGTPPPIRLSDKLVHTVNESVRPVSVWVPIDEVSVEGNFQFADAVLAPLSLAELDEVLDSGGLAATTQEGKQARDKLYPEWSGQTVMRFELCAEPKRAAELAAQRAEDYMTLLQFFTAPRIILPLVSHVAPRGVRPYRIKDHIVSGPKLFQFEQYVAEPSYQFEITAEQRAEMCEMGLPTLSRLAQRTECEYEEKLLDSLLIYGRACYHLDPNDKLLQVITAFEMFALRDGNEPIQAALADRMAFCISNDPSTRQEIVRNVRDAYSIRSGRTHHGKSISETETIEQFLFNAWGFFLAALRGIGRYRTRIEFLDYLDRTKYGHVG